MNFKNTTLILLLFCINQLQAQVEIEKHEIELTSLGLTANNISYVNYPSNKEEILLTFLDSVQLHVVPVSFNFEKKKDSLTYTFPDDGYTIKKTLVSKNTIEYLVLSKKGNLSILKYDFKLQKWIFGNSLVNESEQYLFSILFQDKIYLFNYNKNDAAINVYTAATEGSTVFKSFNIADFNLGENHITDFFKKKRKELRVINTNSPVELFASIKHKKVFQFAEKINITIEDSISNAVGLLQLNLKTKKQSFYVYKAEKTSCEKSLFINSALTENYLTIFSGCLEQGKLTIWDLKSNKKLKTTTINKEQLISFKNYDNLISPKKAESIEKLKPIVLLQKFSAKNASICLQENEANLNVMVGYSKVKKKKGNKAKKKGTGTGKGGGGGNGTGGGKQRKLQKEKRRHVKGYGLSKSYINYEVSNPKFFNAQFNLQANDFDVNTSFENVFEEVKKVKQSLNQRLLPGNQLLIIINKQLWYAYINNSHQKLLFLKVK